MLQNPAYYHFSWSKTNYEFTNHLGNVLSVISDKPITADGTSIVYENHFDNIPDNFIYENDFSSSLDGFYAMTGSTTVNLSSGRLVGNLDFSGAVRIDLPTTVGHKYMVSYNIELDTIGVTYGVAVETASWAYLFGQYQEFAGNYNHVFEATSTSTTFYFYAQDGGSHLRTIYLDDFKLNDVTGETTYEPFIGAYSVSLSIEGNRLKAEHIAVWTQPYMYFSSVPGHTYRVTATADVDAGAGSYFYFDAFDASGGFIAGLLVNADNTYTFDFTATTSTSRIDFQNGVVGDWTLYIDDFSIEDITTSVKYLADIRQSTDYSAFGVQLSGRTLTNSSVSKKYRMGYQGSEMDNEVKGSGNSYTTEFRQLDPRLGRWLTLDPKGNPLESPYAVMSNNPNIYTDQKGDTVYYFNSDGVYIKTEPKEYLSGSQHGIKIIDAKNFQPTALNGVAEFAFNDQKLDVKRMEKAIKEYGTSKPLVFIKSATNIAAYVQDACGDKIKSSYTTKLSWAKRNSVGGRIDFWHTYLVPELLKIGYNSTVANEGNDAGPFYVFNGSGMAYNVMDAGNFLWGRSMHVMGFDKTTMKTGEMWNDPHDPIADQMAISSGYDNDTEWTKKYGLPISRNDPNQTVKYDKSKSNSVKSKSSGKR